MRRSMETVVTGESTRRGSGVRLRVSSSDETDLTAHGELFREKVSAHTLSNGMGQGLVRCQCRPPEDTFQATVADDGPQDPSYLHQ